MSEPESKPRGGSPDTPLSDAHKKKIQQILDLDPSRKESEIVEDLMKMKPAQRGIYLSKLLRESSASTTDVDEKGVSAAGEEEEGGEEEAEEGAGQDASKAARESEEEDEPLPSFTSMRITPRHQDKVPVLFGEIIDKEQFILDIFAKNNLLFKPSKPRDKNDDDSSKEKGVRKQRTRHKQLVIPESMDFNKQLQRETREQKVEWKQAESTEARFFTNLINNHSLVRYTSKIHKEFFPNSHYSFGDVKKILAGVKLNEEGKIIEKVELNANLYILNPDKDPGMKLAKQILDDRINQLVTASRAKIDVKMEATDVAPTDLDYLESFSQQTIYDPSEPVSIIDYYQDIIQFLEHSFSRVCETCGTRIGRTDDQGVMSSGGLISVRNEQTGIELLVDEEILKLTILADFYRKNKNNPNYIYTFQSVLNGKPIQKVISKREEYLKEMEQFEKELRCPNPNCPKRPLLVKSPTLEIAQFVSQITVALINGLPIVLEGVPGDGKSTLAIDLLIYFRWRYGTPYESYNVNDGTTEGKLSGMSNLVAIGNMGADDDIKPISYGILTLSLLKRGGELGGFGANLLLDELNRTEWRQVAFLMGFLAKPYSYTVDADNFRRILYPNRSKYCRWVFLATINRQDIGNEQFSIAGKGRFAFIDVGYSVEQIKRILMAVFDLDASKHDFVLNYLMKLYEFTESLSREGNIKYHAGIRHLIRVHENIMEGLRVRLLKLKIKTPDYDKVSMKLEGNYVDTFAFGNEKLKQQDVLDLMDEVIRSNLLNIIVDESSKTQVDSLNDAWEGQKKDAVFSTFATKYKDIL